MVEELVFRTRLQEAIIKFDGHRPGASFETTQTGASGSDQDCPSFAQQQWGSKPTRQTLSAGMSKQGQLTDRFLGEALRPPGFDVNETVEPN